MPTALTTNASLKISLVGPQNCGKTTLFNALTGSRFQTVNYPGSTVEYNVGKLKKSYQKDFVISDTPGIHSLWPDSIDQQITVDQLFSEEHRPDVIVVVVDATQFSRHYPLALELMQTGYQVVLAVTMLDLLGKEGKTFNEEKLAELSGCPVVELDVPRKSGIPVLLNHIEKLKGKAEGEGAEAPKKNTPAKEELLSRFKECERIESQVIGAQSLQKVSKFDFDKIFLHPVIGLALFVCSMVVVFSAIFWWAAPAMDIIDELFGYLVTTSKESLPASWWSDLLADGIIAGIGSVIIFLPQIIILFMCMSILEDSGYLARGAMLIDRPLRAIGLTGRSFLPMLSGFACAIPAMMAARTISNTRERLLTLLILPLMTCSARLPVYALLIAFMIPSDKPWLGGLLLTALYLGGIVAGTVVATIASKFMKNTGSEASTFMLELPSYKRPQLKVIAGHTFHRSMEYIKKAGPTILVISLGLWLLTHLPAPGAKKVEGEGEYVQISQSWAALVGKTLEPVTEPMGLDWRGGVAMICGFAAREVFVSSMALMYRIEDDDEDTLRSRLLHRMQTETFPGTDQKIFTLGTCLGMLFFFTFALQCFPTVVVAKNESRSTKFALVQLTLFTVLAYAGAVVIVQGMRITGLG